MPVLRHAALLGLAGLLQAWSLAWPWAGGWPTGEPVPGLQIFSLAVCFWQWRQAPTARVAAWRTWWWAQVWLAASWWWLFVSMHRYGGMPAPVAALGVWALSAALAIYYAAVAALAWRWRGATWSWQALVWAGLWALAEWARGTAFTGFPWAAGAYAHTDSLGWAAPWVGVYGIAALAAVWAVLVVQTFRGGNGVLPRPLGAPLALGLALLALWPGARSVWPLAADWTQAQGPMRAVLLQGNIPQDEKFTPGAGLDTALAWYPSQAAQAWAREPGVLVLAPETAIPVLPQRLPDAWWATWLGPVQAGAGALLVGMPVGDAQTGYRNAALAWRPGAPLWQYTKHHLVPFGEFVPPGFAWWVRQMQIPLGEFQRGALPQPPLVWQGQRLAVHICYEDLFGEELAQAFRDPDQAPTVLVNLSNIAWFGDTVAVAQHRQIARMRALELQRPVLRATNTGATVAIDHLGRVSHALAPWQRGALSVEVQGRQGTTPYAFWAARWGWWPWVGGVLVLLCLAWRRTGPDAP